MPESDKTDSLRARLGRAWRALSRSQQRNLALAALLLLLAAFLQPVWRGLQPEVAVGAELRHFFSMDPAYPFDGTPGLDPWGRRWVAKLGTDPSGRAIYRWLYSLGPDGVDQGGAGDDVLAIAGGRGLLFLGIADSVYLWAPICLFGLGVFALGWSWRFGLPLVTSARSRRGELEVLKALVLAPPLCAAGLLAALGVGCLGFVPAAVVSMAFELIAGLHPLGWSPLPAAFAAGLVPCFLAVYLVRHTAASDPSPRAAHVLDGLVASLCLVLLAGGPPAQQAWREQSYGMRIVAAYQSGSDVDPWGTPWIHDGNLDGYGWSAGANRVNEGGFGDDWRVIHGLWRGPAEGTVYRYLPELFLVAAVLVLLGWLFLRALFLPWLGRRMRANSPARPEPPG